MTGGDFGRGKGLVGTNPLAEEGGGGEFRLLRVDLVGLGLGLGFGFGLELRRGLVAGEIRWRW